MLAAAADAPAAPAVLDEVRLLTEPAMRAAVARLHPRLARVESYHRGWTTAAGEPLSGLGGKSVRPALAVLSARSVGGPQEQGICAAVAVELVHDFSLLHDDVMDGDLQRRHRPTAWTQYGVGEAVLAGDALLSLATEVVLESGGPHVLEGVRSLQRDVAELLAGQAMDMEFESRSDVTLDESMRMAAGKTGALLGCACSLGAQLAGGAPDQIAALRLFGRELGMAFQLVDDLLGVWGDPAVTGKPVLADLRQRKKTLPIMAAISMGGDGLRELQSVLAAEPAAEIPREQLAAAARELEQAGIDAWAAGQARHHLAAAGAAIAPLGLPTDVHAPFMELARYTVERWC
jgi:geranylgeranyl diphosphate synthase type I